MSAIEARRAALALQSELLELDVDNVDLDLKLIKRQNDVDGELETVQVASLTIGYKGESFIVYIDVEGNVWGVGADAWESTFSDRRAVAFGKSSKSWDPAHTADFMVKRLPALLKSRLAQKVLFKKYFKR